MLNRLGLNGPGEAGQRDPGSNNSNYLNDGTDADAMAETRERIGGSLSTSIKQSADYDGDKSTRVSEKAGPAKPLPTPGKAGVQDTTEGARTESTEPPISMMAFQILRYG